MESHHLKGLIESKGVLEKMYGAKKGSPRAEAAIHKIEAAKETFERLMEIKGELENVYYEIISHKN